ncbi:MAG: hypothetical protein SFV19_07650 [Rhodospirillaceae bacterium]|nr:hypothetical protein [Rhodospirillaceae bacterium]
MHPNAFLRSLWRPEIRDIVFVAMDFEPRFQKRFDDVIKPAIEGEPIAGIKLSAYRVDSSKTGDSILTDIVDGIAHARLVLADVSVTEEGRYTEKPIRNANVMYEVGIALASRTAAECLIVRDDTKKFLFDVSTIPHATIDFTNPEIAIPALRSLLADRLRETHRVRDARVMMAAATCSESQIHLLKTLATLKPDIAILLGREIELGDERRRTISLYEQDAIDRLMEKGCLKAVAVEKGTGSIFYSLTGFGRAVNDVIKGRLKEVEGQKIERNDALEPSSQVNNPGSANPGTANSVLDEQLPASLRP